MTDEPTVEEQIAAKFAGASLDAAPAEEADTAPETPEPETEPETDDAPIEDTPPSDPELDAYLAKYGGDTEQALRAAVEAQKVIGRQSAEVAEARQMAQQIAELRQIADTQAAAQQPGYDPGAVEDWLAQNPQQIQSVLEQARASGDGYLYGKALVALADIDQAAAFDYHANAVTDAKIASLRQELAPVLTTVQRQQTGTEFAAAFQGLSQKHPDFAQVMNNVTQDTLTSLPPEFVGTLQSGTLESKQRVLETLYWSSKGQQAGNLAEAAQNAAATTHAATQADRIAATVASTAASSDRVPVEKNSVEQYRENLTNSLAFKKAAGLV